MWPTLAGPINIGGRKIGSHRPELLKPTRILQATDWVSETVHGFEETLLSGEDFRKLAGQLRAKLLLPCRKYLGPPALLIQDVLPKPERFSSTRPVFCFMFPSDLVTMPLHLA